MRFDFQLKRKMQCYLSPHLNPGLNPQDERRVLVAVLVLAAALRLLMAPVVTSRMGYLPDVLAYRNSANEILSLTLLSDQFVMPGYPLLIALTGGGIGQLLADTAVALVGVWCVMRIARELSGDPLAGLLAALIWTVYPFAIFYTVIGLTENWFVTLFLLGFLGYLRGQWFWGSLAMVVAILTRPIPEILAPILIVTFGLFVHRLGLREVMKNLGVYALIYVVVMAPWWWHNYERYGQFVRLNLASGLVLYSGNNENNIDGGGVEVRITIPGYGAVTDEIERDRMLKEAAKRFIVENPRRFLELAVIKFGRLWRPWPYAREYSGMALAVVAAAAFLPVLALAMVGAIGMLRRRDRRLLPIVFTLGYITAIHMITIGSLRYRFPMEPFLVVLAAAPSAWIVRRLLRGPSAPAPLRGSP